MKKIIFTIIFLKIFLIGFTQTDHLEPIEDINNLSKESIEYNSNIEKILFNGFSENYFIRYLVKPSFKTEYALQIECKKNKYYLVFHQAKKSIWYTDNKSEIRIKKRKSKIQKKDVELIMKLYNSALNKTQKIEKDYVRIDGTNYIFSLNENGVKKGATWSPKKDTKMYQLKNINELLIKKTKFLKLGCINVSLKNTIIDLSNYFQFYDEKKGNDFISDTILLFLNKNLNLNHRDIIKTNGYFEYEYIINPNGKINIQFIKTEKDDDIKGIEYLQYKIENMYNYFNERKQLKKFKSTLKNLDFSFLNLKYKLTLDLIFIYDKKQQLLK